MTARATCAAALRHVGTATALALSLWGNPTIAQDHPNHKRGTDAATAFAYDQLDAVNLYNGNLTINIPIGQEYPVGAGFGYSLNLHYNSNAWEFEEGPYNQWEQPTTTAFPDPHANAGMGWVLSLGRLHAPLSGRFNTSTSWLLVEPDGNRRQFSPTLHDGETPTTNVFYTRDGSYLRMRPVGAAWEVESPSGLVRTFDASGRLTQIRDRTASQPSPAGTNNSLSISYGTNLWTLTDNSNYPSGAARHASNRILSSVGRRAAARQGDPAQDLRRSHSHLCLHLFQRHDSETPRAHLGRPAWRRARDH